MSTTRFLSCRRSVTLPALVAGVASQPANGLSRFSALLRLSFGLAMLFLLLPGVEVAMAQPATPQTPSAAVELTQAERAWLAGNHTVRARVADYPPYMLTKPEPSGIAVDYLAAVARRYGFKVEFLPDSLGFLAAVQDVMGPRQHYDLILTFTRTPEREKQFAITSDYLTAPWVVYARHDSPYIIGLESLGGKTVAAEKGYVIGNKIKSDYPAIRILEVPKSEDALLAVATGQADAYVGNLANASYLIKANRFDNLVVTAPTSYGINTQAMAVRSDWPELAGLINKGIATMTSEERNAITQKWGAAEFKLRIDYTLVWQIVAAALLIFLAFLYWNRKLAREIALRKQVEGGLRLAKELAESANRAKAIFLATMSHELRTPLSGIIGMTELVKRKLADKSQIDQLNQVLASSNTLLKLIDDILDLSRLEAGHLELEQTEFDLGAVLENLSKLLKPVAQRKGLLLKFEIDPELATCQLLGDGTCLGQVLFKLTDNAIKFTATGTISVHAFVMQQTHEDTLLRFSVTDTGIGIQSEDQKRLFSVFEQLDGSMSRQFGGTGLGLAICKRLVQAMDGTIGVDSQVGMGSTFWFTVRLGKVKTLPSDERVSG